MNDTTLRQRIGRHWRWLLPLTAGLAALVGWLAFGYFGVHTLFIDEEVDEAAPIFDSGAGSSGLPSDAISEELASAMNERAAEIDMPMEDPVSEPPAMPPATDAQAETDAGAEIEVVALATGIFVARSHPSSGTALVLNDGTEQRFLRFEDFETDNGPDLNVYLSAAPADAPAGDFVGDFVDLGDLKGNIGPQNYEIPVDVDLDRYRTVVIWCVRFGVAFGAAELETAAV